MRWRLRRAEGRVLGLNGDAFRAYLVPREVDQWGSRDLRAPKALSATIEGAISCAGADNSGGSGFKASDQRRYTKFITFSCGLT